MLAKVCSDQNKPNGQYQIVSTVDAVMSFIATLPVKKVSGIGPVQGQILNAIGIHTCSDMWEKRDLLDLLFSETSVDFYIRVALGIGSTVVKSDHVQKSIGNEHTFREIHHPADLHRKCQELCDELIEDLKSHNMLVNSAILFIYLFITFC
ncbi:DNA polymerase kappa-like [Stegodyphus dumicola]|uniref:DNA polymerase kappa-like n=1 Tax=Stegodyphus dumicola TaxID=202533 RepID=UPI0015ACBD20|nr:DNA polymerase kappa-like [Stegodyphus dumicola]